ncbi:hypothetical protein GF376_03870 [Candidatus Peregrinibacteria bacterium]|nr:hypothetical protein [Candidatus Peregrinibacteria bacterium]
MKINYFGQFDFSDEAKEAIAGRLGISDLDQAVIAAQKRINENQSVAFDRAMELDKQAIDILNALIDKYSNLKSLVYELESYKQVLRQELEKSGLFDSNQKDQIDHVVKSWIDNPYSVDDFLNEYENNLLQEERLRVKQTDLWKKSLNNKYIGSVLRRISRNPNVSTKKSNMIQRLNDSFRTTNFNLSVDTYLNRAIHRGYHISNSQKSIEHEIEQILSSSEMNNLRNFLGLKNDQSDSAEKQSQNAQDSPDDALDSSSADHSPGQQQNKPEEQVGDTHADQDSVQAQHTSSIPASQRPESNTSDPQKTSGSSVFSQPIIPTVIAAGMMANEFTPDIISTIKEKQQPKTNDETPKSPLSNIKEEFEQLDTENSIEIPSEYLYQSPHRNIELIDISEVERPNDVIAVGDLFANYFAFEHNLLSEGVVKKDPVNDELNWIGDDAKVVLLGDIIADRGETSLSIIESIAKLNYQAKEVSGEIIYLCGNHDIVAINFLAPFVKLPGNNNWHSLDLGGQIKSLGEFFVRFGGNGLPSMTQDELEKKEDVETIAFDLFSQEGIIVDDRMGPMILERMKQDEDGKKMLDVFCRMRLLEQVDDSLYLHTELTNPIKAALSNPSLGNSIPERIDTINAIFQHGLRIHLLGEPGQPSVYFSELINAFTNTNNRDYLTNTPEEQKKLFADFLKTNGIFRVIHGHSGLPFSGNPSSLDNGMEFLSLDYLKEFGMEKEKEFPDKFSNSLKISKNIDRAKENEDSTLENDEENVEKSQIANESADDSKKIPIEDLINNKTGQVLLNLGPSIVKDLKLDSTETAKKASEVHKDAFIPEGQRNLFEDFDSKHYLNPDYPEELQSDLIYKSADSIIPEARSAILKAASKLSSELYIAYKKDENVDADDVFDALMSKNKTYGNFDKKILKDLALDRMEHLLFILHERKSAFENKKQIVNKIVESISEVGGLTDMNEAKLKIKIQSHIKKSPKSLLKYINELLANASKEKLSRDIKREFRSKLNDKFSSSMKPTEKLITGSAKEVLASINRIRDCDLILNYYLNADDIKMIIKKSNE